MTALPQEFQALIIDETVLKLNRSDYSFKKSWQMIVKGKELLLGGPVVKGKEVSWMVESQTNSKKAYTVCITPKPLKKYKAKRDSYKNFSYKCTCENFEVFVLTNSKIIILSNYKIFSLKQLS